MSYDQEPPLGNLQMLARIVQLSRLREQRLKEAEALGGQLARLRGQCSPQLRRTIDRLTLIDAEQVELARHDPAREGVKRN